MVNTNDIDYLSALLAQHGINATPSVDDYESLSDNIRPGYAYQSQPASGGGVNEVGTPYIGANLGSDISPASPKSRRMMSADPYGEDIATMADQRIGSLPSVDVPQLPPPATNAAPKINVNRIMGGDTSQGARPEDYQYDLGELVNGKPGESPEEKKLRGQAQGRALLDFGLKMMAQSGGPNSKGLLGDIGVAGGSTLSEMDARKEKSEADKAATKKERSTLLLEAAKENRDQYNKDRTYGVDSLKANSDAMNLADLAAYRQKRLGQYDAGLGIEGTKADAAIAAAGGKGSKGSADMQMISHLQNELGWDPKKATDFVVSQHPDFTKAFQIAYSSISNSPSGMTLPPDQLFKQAMKMAQGMTDAQSKLPTAFTQYSGQGAAGDGAGAEDPEEIRKRGIEDLLRSRNFLNEDDPNAGSQ